MLTKGKMIQILKKNGVRCGDKNGSVVSLEHLKTFHVIELYYKYCV